MPFSPENLKRMEQLCGIIEGHKPHEYAAPTYKDSPYLSEMARIALAPRAHDRETLEELIPALWYLTQSYDRMCRAGMSVKFYPPQLAAHTELMALREYDSEDRQRFENCFYLAVKARNIMNRTTAPILSRWFPAVFRMTKSVHCFSRHRKAGGDSSKTIPLRKRRNTLRSLMRWRNG